MGAALGREASLYDRERALGPRHVGALSDGEPGAEAMVAARVVEARLDTHDVLASAQFQHGQDRDCALAGAGSVDDALGPHVPAPDSQPAAHRPVLDHGNIDIDGPVDDHVPRGR